jgi:hypothetical protein
MDVNSEVIAMLLPDLDSSGIRGSRDATLLVRSADGQMSIQTINADSTLGQHAMLETGCFRRGKPIFDPISQQTLGYEMEMIPSPLVALRNAAR